MKRQFFLISLVWLLLSGNLGWSQNHFIESFENPDSWSGYTTGTVTFDSGDWDFLEVYPETSGDSYDGSKACRINDDVAGASITSPSVNGVGTVSFYYHRPFSGTGSFELQKSVGGGACTTLVTVNYSSVTTPTQYTYDVNDASNDIRIRIVNDDNTAHLTIDYFEMGSYSAGIDPEPTNHVSAFSATADDANSITITWNDNDGAQPAHGFLIKANTGTITSPTDNNFESDDTDLTDGSGRVNVNHGVETYTFTNCAPSTTYNFEIYPYTNSGSDIDYKTGGTIPADVATTDAAPTTINEEDFSACGSLTWTAVDVAGDDSWSCGSGYMDINGYGGSADEDYLIINTPIDFNSYTLEELVVQTNERYDGPDLELRYSTDFNGTFDATNVSAATWNAITFTPNDASSGSSFSGWSDNTVDLSGISGTAYIAFRYEATGSGGSSEHWRVDNIQITGTAGSVYDTDSDIIAVSSSESTTVSSIENTSGPLTSTEGVQVWQFTIRDGGAGGDSDSEPTIVNAIDFTQAAGNAMDDWDEAILSADLFDGTTHLATATITNNELQFSGSPIISVADDATKTLSLRISISTTPNTSGNNEDGDDFGLQISQGNVTADASGSGFSSFSPIQSANDQNVFEVVATELAFVQQPTNVDISTVMSPSPTVEATDANGNRDLDYDGVGNNISLTTTGTFDGTATTTVQALSGLSTFNNILYSATGSGITISTINTNGLSNATSDAFDILQPPITIAYEDFCTDGGDWNHTDSPAEYDLGSDEWHCTTSQGGTSASSGSQLWGFQDIDNSSYSGDHTLTFDEIDISSYTSVELAFDWFTNGYNGSDMVGYQVAYDGGAFGSVIVLCNGCGGSGNWSTETINIDDSKTSVQLRLIANQDGGGQHGGFDNVLLTGMGSSCSTPTSQASFNAFTGIAGTQLDVNWTRGDGEYVLIVAREGSAVTFEPTDNTTYAANASFSSGADVGTGEYVVYNGTGTTETVTNLSANTTYHFAAFEYNCTGGDEVYLTPGDAASQGTINYINTGAIAGSPFCVTSSATDNVTVDFTYATGSSFGSGSCTFTAQLSDETGSFASPISLGTVSSDESGSQSISGTIPVGTTSGTGYRIRVVSDVPDITGSDNGSDIEIVLGPANVVAGTPSEENTQVVLNWTNPSTCYDEVLVVASEASISATPSGDGSSYTADPVYGDGTDIGTSEYVVYKGTAETETVTSLTNGTTYYFKIFTRNGTEWSNGVEFSAEPTGITVLEYGDLAILAVNTAQSSGDEISFVAFKTIATGTEIDFTDNGYERETATLWGNTEGTLRFTRTGANIPAGTVITFVGEDGDVLGTDFDIFVGGVNDNSNWTLSSLNGNKPFNMNVDDQIWIMQNGTWNSGTLNNHDATYDGNVLYGWSAEGWEAAPGYDDSKGSTKHEDAECSITDVGSITTNNDKVKYTGPTTSATKIEWIGRINNADNWTAYENNTDFDDGLPKYRVDGATLTLEAGTIDEGKWAGYKDSVWCDCANWMHLKVPTASTNVNISSDAVNNVYLSAHPDSLAECNNLTVDSRNVIRGQDGASLTVNSDLTISTGQLNFTGTTTSLIAHGNITIDADTAILGGAVELAATGTQSVDMTSETDLTLENFTPKGSGTKSFSTNIESLTLTGDMNIEGSAVFDPLYTDFLLDIQGDWTSYGEGGFTETGVTVTLSGTSTQTITTTGGETFVDLWITNNTADGVALGSNLTVSGEIDLEPDGVLKPGATARTITLTANGAASNSLEGSGTATIDLSGAAHTLNIACESPGFTGTLTGGTTSIVNYNRSGNQSIMDDANIDYANLTLSGSGIKDIDSDLEIVGNLLLDNVTLNASAGSQTLIIEGNLTLQNSSSMTNTLTNLDLWLDGTNNQVFRGNGADLAFNDILSFKTSGNITLSNTGGTSNLISNNDIVIDLAGGNLTDNGNTLEAGDDIEIGNGGTINLTGTLELNGSNVAGDMHLSAENGASKFPAALNGITVGNDAFELYPTGGGETFDINGSVVIENGATFDANGNDLNIGGNWTTHSNVDFTETGVDVTFDGGANQTITSGDSEVFEDLIVNKPGGNLILANDVSTSTLTLTNGLVETEAHKITVTSTTESAISGHGTDAYVYGNLVRHVSAVNTYDFPIGSASNYELGTIELNTFDGTAITGSFNAADPGYSWSTDGVLVDGTPIIGALDAGFWIFTPNGGSSFNYDITLFMNGHNDPGVSDACQFTVLKRDGGNWQSQGTHNNGDQSGTGTSTISAKRSGLTSFSDFMIGYGNNVLPVEWLSLDAHAYQKGININWLTASEINNDYFEIEHSTDGSHYNSVGRVEGQGNSNSINTYQFLHQNPVAGANYYRIRQVDYDGNYDYSDIVTATWTGVPMHGLNIAYVYFGNDDQKALVEFIPNREIAIFIFDIHGNILYQNQQITNAHFTSINLSQLVLDPGLYVLKVSSDRQLNAKKFIVRE